MSVKKAVATYEPVAGVKNNFDKSDCPRCNSGIEETAEHAFYYCEPVRPFWDHVGEWTARIETKQLVLLDLGYRLTILESIIIFLFLWPYKSPTPCPTLFSFVPLA